MGKKTKGSASAGGDTAGRMKLPKRIAGVKIPKELRRSAEAVVAEVQKPGTRELIATGAALAVSAVMAARERHAGPATPGAPTRKPGTPGIAPGAADPIVDALGSAARQVLNQMFARKL